MLKLEYKHLIINSNFMVKRENKTIRMITTNEEEILEKLVAGDWQVRSLLWDW